MHMAATNVRFWPKADIPIVAADVRFTPESGHFAVHLPCPLWANSGHQALFRTRAKLPRRFEQLDRIPIGVCELNLFATGT